MNKDELRAPDYLAHILQAIERITTYTEDIDVVGFLNNELIQDAVIRNIEIIGEAAHNVDTVYPSFANEHPNVPWQDMYWMRNRVSHGYFSVDLEIVWKTIQRDIPELAQQVKDVLQKLVQQN
jgi:uncharacterized protein with HEPN domain